MANTETVEVRNRWTDRVQFTAEITCSPDATVGVKLGLAVRWARKSGADLRGADLRGADLRGADLRDAVLRGADLRSFKADLWMTLTQARAEVPALVTALRNGKVNGSQYEGACACLVGTLANAKGENYRAAFPDASSRHPAEQWFLMIREGDKPGDDTGGGFASAKALEWTLEYCALTGIEIDPAEVPTQTPEQSS